jgi:hypothetical protein
MYCNEGGRCVKYKSLGERCSSNEACGRKALCIFETTLSTYGTCQEILSKSIDNLVLPMYKTDMAETDSNIFVYQQDYEKVCRSGYLNTTSGRCVAGLKSKNKVRWLGLYLFICRVACACQTWIALQLIRPYLLSASAVTHRRELSIAILKVEMTSGSRLKLW